MKCIGEAKKRTSVAVSATPMLISPSHMPQELIGAWILLATVLHHGSSHPSKFVPAPGVFVLPLALILPFMQRKDSISNLLLSEKSRRTEAQNCYMKIIHFLYRWYRRKRVTGKSCLSDNTSSIFLFSSITRPIKDLNLQACA